MHTDDSTAQEAPKTKTFTHEGKTFTLMLDKTGVCGFDFGHGLKNFLQLTQGEGQLVIDAAREAGPEDRALLEDASIFAGYATGGSTLRNGIRAVLALLTYEEQLKGLACRLKLPKITPAQAREQQERLADFLDTLGDFPEREVAGRLLHLPTTGDPSVQERAA